MKKKRNHLDVTADPFLLTYLASTYPAPLQVSTPQTPVTGLLHMAAINQGTKPVYCNKVLVAVPIGPDVNELFATSPTPIASCNTNKWTISSMEIKPGKDLGLNTDIPYATFTFTCRAQSDFLINYNLVFGVQGQMTQIISGCTIVIRETSGTASDPNTFTNKQQALLTVETSPPQFYLQNFVSTAPDKPTAPATEFANGADIQFGWESNGTFFEIFQKNVSKPIYAGTKTNFRLSGGAARDTTFFLVAMMNGNPAGDQSSAGYEPIYLYDAVTVIISNPDLTPRSAAISGNASVDGTFGVKGQTALGNTNVGGTLGVNGQTNLGNASVGGILGVTGQTNLGSATVGGSLEVMGLTYLNNITNNGPLDVTGPTTLKGGLVGSAGFVSMFTMAQKIWPGTFAAKTDGFVLGSVVAPASPGTFTLGYIAGENSDGAKLCATGGNIAVWDTAWTRHQGSHNESFTLPVRRGTTFTVSTAVVSGGQDVPTFNFWWVPVGAGWVGESAERISDEYPPIEAAAISRDPVSHEKNVKALIDLLEDSFEKQISREKKNRLVSAFLDVQA